jgi:MOSC domain-containing protein YiiM
LAELEELWQKRSPAPRDRGEVALIVARPVPGVHEVLHRGRLSVEGGLEGDRWAKGRNPDPDRQLTLMNVDVVRWITEDEDIPLHVPGDNFLVDFDLSEESMPVGKRVRLGEALLVVSPKSHTGCKKFEQRFGTGALQWVMEPGNSGRRLRGINCTVLEPGMVTVGDSIVPV